MTRHRSQSRRMGQDIRAWPMLALLLVAVLAAIGGVLWFMREAIDNGRLAARQKVVEAYGGQLELLQKQVENGWRDTMARFDAGLAAPASFAKAAREDWADAIICLDPDGRPSYPRNRLETRDADANMLLLRLEQSDANSPEFAAAAAALQARVNDYESGAIPSSQRRFLMRELQRLAPGTQFPTLPAEDLAARYLEEHPAPEKSAALHATKLRDVWACASPGGQALALFSSARLRAEFQGLAGTAAPATRAQVIPPGEAVESALVSRALGSAIPGWQLAISAADDGLFDATADRAASAYLWTAGAVIAGLAVLGTLVARGLGRQVKLTRLKTDLVAMVSHELKTPLTGMRALVDTLLDAEKLDEKTTREYLELVARENARLSALIENFLTFSRLERNKFAFRFEPVPPGEIIEAALAAMGERRHEPDCRIDARIAPNLPPVIGDRGALTTALVNLLDNAWKYTGEQKRISVRAEARNGSVCFAVEDNGIGLGAKERARVFDRFYQVDQRLAREAGGCGLGLSIARSIAEAHHGAVSVESEAGRGSTFTLEIPAHAP